ncbi:MAG: aldehyde dehydrogenase family protein [Solirubrobacteraceae bacterium]|jgi:delta 1-pyrroline-5-carboxylate dehydrogenase
MTQFTFSNERRIPQPIGVIDKTVDGIIGSAFGAAGQRCMAGSVIVTVGDAHGRLLPVLTEKTRTLRVGDGLEEGTDVGPVLCVINAATLDEAIAIVNASRFGNGASIFTESAASVRRYRHDVEAGMAVGVIAARDRLLAGEEVDPVAAVGVQVAEEARLPIWRVLQPGSCWPRLPARRRAIEAAS